MALITSAASGNFNAGATWTGGVVPTTGDEARASTGHTITINVDTTCDEISNAGTGKFVINDGITLTANVTHKSATATTNCLEFSTASPSAASIVGNCTAGTLSASQRGAANLSSGTLNITGDCNGGSGNFNYGALNNSTGTINITGNCNGGSGSSIEPSGVSNSSSGTVNITGNCTAGSGVQTYGALNRSTGAMNVTGNCTGGTAAASGVFNFSTGTLSVIGTIQASQTAAGVAGTNAQQVTILSGPFLTETTRGVAPVYCLAWRWNASPSNSTYLEVMTNDLLVKRSLYTADNITGMPDEADVKDGVVYGPSSELTGTFEQTVSPSIEGIAAGVWDYALSSITTSDTIGQLLKTNIDATISSRSTATTAGIADAVWDEVLTGATHNVNASAGRRLRQLASSVVIDGEVVSATSNTVTLDAAASADDGAYDPALILITEGPGAGESRLILAYNGSTKTCVVDRDWKVNPTNLSKYVIVSDPGREHVNEGLAQGGTSTTIILNASASTADDAYIGQVVFVRSGTGSDQARRIVDYVGSTRTATVDREWATTPDTTSGYVMLPTGEFSPNYTSAAIRSELTPELDEIGEIHLIHGLKSGESLTVTPTSRTAGAVSQTIGGDGTTTTTVSRD
jgi:hypothetical protein